MKCHIYQYLILHIHCIKIWKYIYIYIIKWLLIFLAWNKCRMLFQIKLKFQIKKFQIKKKCYLGEKSNKNPQQNNVID